MKPRRLSPEDGEAVQRVLHATLNQVWRIHVTTVLMAIWRRRSQWAHRSDRHTTIAQQMFTVDAIMMRRLQLHRLQLWTRPNDADRRYTTWIVDVFLHYYLCAYSHVLFFDGGSTGNPGKGGTGSVIVLLKPDKEPVIQWVHQQHLPSTTTTNNVAEFTGFTSCASPGLSHRG